MTFKRGREKIDSRILNFLYALYILSFEINKRTISFGLGKKVRLIIIGKEFCTDAKFSTAYINWYVKKVLSYVIF